MAAGQPCRPPEWEGPMSEQFDGTPTKAKKWSVLVYMAGDNDLTPAAMRDIDELCRVGTNGETHAAVELDTAGDNGSLRYEITPPGIDDRGYRVVIDRLPEQDSGDPLTLRNFLDWGVGRAENAENRIVVIWGHGLGGHVAPDEYSTGGALEMDEVLDAFRQVGIGLAKGEPSWSGKRRAKVSVLGFDACLMGTIENVHYLRDVADYIVASQEIVPEDGWSYGSLLDHANATKAPKDLAVGTVDDYVGYYSNQGQVNVTLAAIDMNAAVALFKALQDLGKAMSKAMAIPGFRDAVAQARRHVQAFYLIDYVDLADLVSLIGKEARTLGDAQKDPAYRDQLHAIAEQAGEVRDTITAGNKGFHFDKGKDLALHFATGLSVYFPAFKKQFLSRRTSYAALHPDGVDTGWIKFLDAYFPA
jgi:hypothetical protein